MISVEDIGQYEDLDVFFGGRLVGGSSFHTVLAALHLAAPLSASGAQLLIVRQSAAATMGGTVNEADGEEWEWGDSVGGPFALGSGLLFQRGSSKGPPTSWKAH